jgi:restriction system protein
MNGRTFEVFVSTLFRRLGYDVEVTRYRGDYGADLVVKKDARKVAVQAKRWRKKVGLKAVQEAVAAKAMYRCNRALVVANLEFTQQARRLARANKVELWDREALVAKLLTAKKTPGPVRRPQVQKQLAVNATASNLMATEPDIAPSVAAAASTVIDTEGCTTCGAAVSERVRGYCLMRPSRFGGRVYCFYKAPARGATGACRLTARAD